MRNLPSLVSCTLCSVLLFGCASQNNRTSDIGRSGQQQATQQTKAFFDQHPEYVNSADRESALFVEFQEVVKDPRYKDLSMYQMLLISHDRLQR